MQSLNDREESLNQREEHLNLQAAKGERREIRKGFKKLLESWNAKYEVSEKTTQKRIIVHILCLALIGAFGTLAGIYLYHGLQTEGMTNVLLYVKQAVFTSLFVATCVVYFKWNTRWFDRRANEEFRLKHLELDFDRASWFTELAFQWREEYGESIPSDLIHQLTKGLFDTSIVDQSADANENERLGSLVSASRRLKLSPEGIEAEFSKKGIAQLKKDEE